jgi:hypothetical protein
VSFTLAPLCGFTWASLRGFTPAPLRGFLLGAPLRLDSGIASRLAHGGFQFTVGPEKEFVDNRIGSFCSIDMTANTGHATSEQQVLRFAQDDKPQRKTIAG